MLPMAGIMPRATRYESTMSGTRSINTAFVAGATGYTGRYVVAALAAGGTRTTAHVRPDSPRLGAWREHFAKLGVKVDSSPWQPDSMREALHHAAPEAIFSLLGTTRARARTSSESGESYETVDLGLTVLLMEAAVAASAALARAPLFVYLSAIGAGLRRGGYLRARWNAEQALEASGLPFVIARPSLITGPDRDDSRPGERVAAGLTNGVAALAKAVGARHTQGRLRSLTGQELATALVAAAQDPAARGRILDAEHLRAQR